MILLSATPVNGHGEFRFRLEAPGRELVETDDPSTAARLLQEFGVEDPNRYGERRNCAEQVVSTRGETRPCPAGARIAG
jgi:hypothetical protein